MLRPLRLTLTATLTALFCSSGLLAQYDAAAKTSGPPAIPMPHDRAADSYASTPPFALKGVQGDPGEVKAQREGRTHAGVLRRAGQLGQVPK